MSDDGIEVVDMREVDLMVLIRDGAATVRGRVKGRAAARWLRHLADSLESSHNEGPEVLA